MARQQKDWEQEYAKLQKEARKLAKRANQRMVRLERYAQREEYSSVTEYAYKEAQRDIRGLYGKTGDRLRFTENQKLIEISDGTKNVTGSRLYYLNYMSLKAKVNAMEKFLGAKSSTLADIKLPSGERKEGIKTVYDKRTATINKKYGTNFTSAQLKAFFASKQQEKLEQAVGSDAMFIVAATIKGKKLASNKREMAKFIKKNMQVIGGKKMQINEKAYSSAGEMLEAFQEFVKLTDDPVLDHYVAQAVKNGVNFQNLFIS